MTAILKAPVGLEARGRALWKAVSEEFALRLDEAEALGVACRTLDELTRIEAAAQDAEPMVAGARGRLIPNPLYEELRRHRATYLRALAALGIKDADADATSASQGARALASQRWRRSG